MILSHDTEVLVSAWSFAWQRHGIAKKPQVEAKRNVEHLMLLAQNSGKIDLIIQFRGHNHTKPQFEPEDQPKPGVVITLAIPMFLQFAQDSL